MRNPRPALGYPLTELFLGMMVHRSSRVLRAEGAVSQYLKPTSSIIAGCMQSTSWARVVMYDLLEEAHNRFPVTIQSWVDDMTQRTHGQHKGSEERDKVAQAMVEAGSLVATGMKAKGCRVNIGKSFILASDSDLASRIQKGIEDKTGTTLHKVQVARDLGIDSGFAKRRRLPTAKGRMCKGVHKLKRLSMISRITIKSRKLFRTGVILQIGWGQEAKGMAPTAIGKFCTRAGPAGAGNQEGVSPPPWRSLSTLKTTRPSLSQSTSCIDGEELTRKRPPGRRQSMQYGERPMRSL
jgi:hypothetical protein